MAIWNNKRGVNVGSGISIGHNYFESLNTSYHIYMKEHTPFPDIFESYRIKGHNISRMI